MMTTLLVVDNERGMPSTLRAMRSHFKTPAFQLTNASPGPGETCPDFARRVLEALRPWDVVYLNADLE